MAGRRFYDRARRGTEAWPLAEIVDGYYRTEMASARKDEGSKPTTRRLALEHQQDGRAAAEERFARDADQPAEERAHRRRAEQAAYLRDKLGEAARSEERAADDA